MSPSVPIPKHVAVIPDGNRRWAKANKLDAKEGHKAGYKNLLEIADYAFECGIEYLTVYSFSTENWNRTQDEVGYLMSLAAWVAVEEGKSLHAKGYQIRILGSADGVDERIWNSFVNLQEQTKDNQNGSIAICFNYGGRRDIVDAVRKIIESGSSSIDEDSFSDWLSTAGMPDPDLIIRTSGESRLSNFLLWEGAYSELYFSKRLWPDFRQSDLDAALEEYSRRKRNFGK